MKKVFFVILFLFIMSSSCTTPINESNDSLSFREYWSKNPVYFLLIDRFANGDKTNDYNVNVDDIKSYHGGDLKGLVDNFSYLDQLNIGTLLFTPIMDNRNKDFFGHWGAHGYWIIDHKKIDEHFGTLNDFQKLINLRKKNHKLLLMDIVLNHVDWDHPWYKDHPEWFHTLGSITDWDDPIQVLEGQVSGLPDLDQDMPEVYDELLKYTLFWLERSGAEGVRLDAVKHIDHTFWKKFITDVKKYQIEKFNNHNFLFLAEILHGDPKYYLPYLEDGFNAFYDYPMYYTVSDVFARKQSFFNLSSRLQAEDEIFPSNVVLATFIDNHDMARFLSLTKEVTISDMKQALFFLMAIRGLPMIYSGTEGNILGANGEDGRKDLDMKHVPNFKYLSLLNKIRNESKSLYKGIRENLIVSDDLYVFRKIWEDEESIVILSRTKESRKIKIVFEENSLFVKKQVLLDRLTGKSFPVKHGALNIDLPRIGNFLFTVKGNALRYAYLRTERPKEIKLNVLVKNLKLKDNEELYMIGGCLELGEWNPVKALGPFMKGEKRIYEGTLLTKSKRILEYKFIKKSPDGTVVWEKRTNRFSFVNDEQAVLEHVWDR